MNTRQKKKHDYFFDFIRGLEGYPRHKFVTRRNRKILFTKHQLRKLYKSGNYWIDWSEFPDEWYPEQYE